MTTRRSRGFTLIEVSVILAVLAVLAGLLFPALGQTRAQARKATCASHLYQIARAGLMYMADYDDRFPSCYSTATPPYAVDPRTSLQPYVRSWELFYCPERHTIMHECLDPEKDFRPDSRCMGYGYNWGSGLGWGSAGRRWDGLVRLSRDPNGPAALVIGVTRQEVLDPAHTLFYGDTNDFHFITLQRQAMPGVRREGETGPPTNDVGQPYEPPRHLGGNNFVFVDGHVEWLRFPGGSWIDGGPRVVPDMSMYSRAGRWETPSAPLANG